MKTTLEINDELFASARARAERDGVTLRSLVEQGLRMVLKTAPPARSTQRIQVKVFRGKPGFTEEFREADWAVIKAEGRRR